MNKASILFIVVTSFFITISNCVPIVYVVYTGGTIGMKEGDDGWEPVSGYLEETMATMPEFQAEDMPTYVVHEFDPLLDSSNMYPSDWCVDYVLFIVIGMLFIILGLPLLWILLKTTLNTMAL